MKFQASHLVFLKLILLLQVGSGSHNPSQNFSLSMQRNVECLIEKIISQIQEYYNQFKTESKCIPDSVSDILMEAVTKSIDCVQRNEKNFTSRKIREQTRSKNFLKCFSNAKKEVKDIMETINPNADYCPENVTEKTYQVNVTTTYTRTFQIYIKNGVEVKHKKIEFFSDFDGSKVGLVTLPFSYETQIPYKFNNSEENDTTDAYGNTTKNLFKTETTDTTTF